MGEGKGGLSYFARWEALVCAVIFAVPAAVAVVVIWKSQSRRRLRASHPWAPCWRGLHPAWLLAYRVVVFAVACLVLSQVYLHEGIYTLYFYTQWTFTLVAVYFAVGSLISALNCWGYSRQFPSATEENNKFLIGDLEESRTNTAVIQASDNTISNSLEHDNKEKKADKLGLFLLILYQTSAGAVLLTDTVFWGLIVPFLMDDHFKLNALIGLMHSLNLVSLFFDTALNSMPFPLSGMAYFVLWSCAYIVFQWILHACGASWWPYPFLELATPWAPLWYFGVALVHIPCYGFYALVVKLKNSLFSKFFTHAYIMS